MIVPLKSRKKVNDELVWLKQNNALYKETILRQSRVNKLPLDGDVNVSVRFINDSQSMDCDKGPVEENEEEVETSSFIPEKRSQPL